MSNSTHNSPVLELAILAEKLPKTYQKALLRLAKTMLKQSQKGIAKYGEDIDQNQNQSLSYWQDHADEELADFLVYQEKIREITEPKMDCENPDFVKGFLRGISEQEVVKGDMEYDKERDEPAQQMPF